MRMLLCPLCREPLQRQDRAAVCANGHSFDFSKEGYLNLLPVNGRRSRHPGDAPEMCRARRAFLSAGHYAPLREAVASLVAGDVVLDACCGEGYYTSAVAETGRETYGFDIAKDMVRMAAKADKRSLYFVAGLHAIPVRDASVDTLLHLFAPPSAAEFRRVLRKGGTLLDVQPGAEHLFGLKAQLYDAPYRNRETTPDFGLPLARETRLRYTIRLKGEQIRDLFRMTPYAYKTAPAAADKLLALPELVTDVEFLIRLFSA